MRKQIIDQSAHFAAGFAAVVLSAWAGANVPPFAGAVMGLALGLTREITQHETFKVWTLGRGSVIDLLFWTLGGLFGGLNA